MKWKEMQTDMITKVTYLKMHKKRMQSNKIGATRAFLPQMRALGDTRGIPGEYSITQ
jgi:hypothetical protein